MNMDLDQATRAREWLAAAEHKWRLQTMQTSTRYDMKTGKYRRLPTKVRRFLNGTPVGMIAEALEILRESAPYKSPVFNHEGGELVYYPTSTYINKDGNPNVTNEKDATYTIVQDLRLYDDASDMLEAGDASSCSSVSTAEYHWDEPDIESLPDGEQGVVWRIDGIRRDDESGLFSYEVKKQQAITQHMVPTLTKVTTRSKTTVETWDNLYGMPGDFRQDPVKGGSLPVDIPEASCSDGHAVEVSVSENPDCTYKVSIVRSDPVTDEDPQMYSILRDQFRIQSTERTTGQAAGLPKSGVEYDPPTGTVTKYTSEKNDDGTWSNTVEKDVERKVVDSVKSVRITPRGVVTSWTDTNMESAATKLAGGKFGEYKSTKTPAGRYVNEYTSYSVARDLLTGTLCEFDLFSFSHERTTGASAVAEPSPDHPAKDGVTASVRYTVDDMGFVTKTQRTEHERMVDDAVVTTNSTAFGTTVTKLYRNKTAAAAASLAESAAVVPFHGTKVSKTKGDLRDVEITAHDPAKTRRTVSTDCGKTVFEHTDSSTTAGAAQAGAHVENAGGGRTARISVSTDPSTGFTTTKTDVTQELTVTGARVEKRSTPRGVTTTTVNRNTSVDPTAGELPVGTTASKETTPGGLLNTTVTKTSPRTGSTGSGCEKNLFRHVDTATRTSGSEPTGHASGGEGGAYSSVTNRLGDDGLWDVTESTTQEQTVPRSSQETRVTSRGTIKSYTDTQVPSTTEYRTPSRAGQSLRYERTPGGWYNVTVTEAPVPSPSDTGKSCDKTHFKHSDTTTRTSASAGADHAEDVARGHGYTHSQQARLGDDGLWDVVTTDTREIRQQSTTTEYGDALVRRTDVKVDNGEETPPEGGQKFSGADETGGVAQTAHAIQSITRQLTDGGLTTSVTNLETPVEAHTPVVHMQAGTTDGLMVYHDSITFRNSTWSQVQGYISQVQNAARYTGVNGSLSVSPTISVTPNKYGLFDGTVGVNTHFTPKAFAAGGSTKTDSWNRTYRIKDVSYTMVSSNPIKFIKTEVTETHVSGGGVGKDEFGSIVGSNAKLKGSTFAYNPGGQSYTYDLITSASVLRSVVGERDTI